MYAARAGARRVYCCEMSPSLFQIAQRCISSNGWSDLIVNLPKHSRDLMIGIDIPTPVDIIVTELVDSGYE